MKTEHTQKTEEVLSGSDATAPASQPAQTGKQWKAVAYAYPTSENARQFGFDKDGCYVVEVSTSKNRIPQAIAGFATSPEAFAFADTLRDHELSQYSVSPEFRVYRPHLAVQTSHDSTTQTLTENKMGASAQQ